jgi:4'-phosphopantetheinyl transferase
MTAAASMPPGWPVAAEPPPLGAGAAHVWRASLDHPESAIAPWLAALSEEEQARAARVVIPEKGRQRAASRAILRGLLGAYLGLPPAQVRLENGPHGKPRLAEGEGQDLRFNVSHSRGEALFAFARGCEVGVDIERIDPRSDTDSIARRFFAAREQRALEALPDAERRVAFFRCWARKEAYLKVRGIGFDVPLGSFEVSVGREAALLAESPEVAGAGRITLVNLNVGPGFDACLAVEGPRPRVACFLLEPPRGGGVL